MRRDSVNARLRAYAKERISPREQERSFVSIVYDSVRDLLGANNCLQIGSFPRFTAITPLHDLDVMYDLGDWSAGVDTTEVLRELNLRVVRDYINPTPYEVRVSKQSHSVVIAFHQGDEEIFSTDIVPAYKNGTNNYGDHIYFVPELALHSHNTRREMVQSGVEIGWIRSDPRGYIKDAQDTNANNADFRKTVKLVKHWKNNCKQNDASFPLKSFHIELIVTQFFQLHTHDDVFAAIFDFFTTLTQKVRQPYILDRADGSRYIDQYVDELTLGQRDRIKEACDYVLVQLENITEETDISQIFAGLRYGRVGASEAFLFDQRIPVLTESEFNIVGEVQQEKMGGFRGFILDAIGHIKSSRKIHFRLGKDAPPADIYKWKVRNDSSSPQPRGEITDNRTLNDPETTKYKGSHYVECYAIKQGVCIARSRQNVVLGQV